MVRANVETDLVNSPRPIIRPEPATAHMLATLQEKYGPVLDTIISLGGDLLFEALPDLSLGQPSPGVDKARDLDVAP
jgi:hypothetical protein